ncbi:ABC transporter permease subunit [Leisingera daeponensis]|uniref:ABC transporter permease subunit n=1 Tax=Leisingera daeponensis TaxID=405746 RepID=UPI001C9761EB|nr:ABC transporter permease subunit [Leisingera daeponensis]MBY6058756.1 ABC transporter permease subunit [Leisingera daeponensis]
MVTLNETRNIAGPGKWFLRLNRSQSLWLLIVLIWSVSLGLQSVAPDGNDIWLLTWPEAWTLPLADGFNKLIYGIAEFNIFKGFAVADGTRAFNPVIDTITQYVSGLIDGGIKSGFGSNTVQIVPPLSWLGVLIAITLLGHRLGGFKLAGLTSMSFVYLLTFDLWGSAAITIAQMLIAVPLALAIGIGVGIWLYYSPRIRPVMLLIVDQAQTIPIFSYLVPIVVFFGLGSAPAIVAAVIYAAPATVRAAILGLEQSEAQVGELAASTGATFSQTLFSFLLPTARTALQTGGTQVVLLAFSTGILASLVGSGGLGYDVLVAMRQLNIGRGIEAGLAITLLAIISNNFIKVGFGDIKHRKEVLTRKVFLLLTLGSLLLLTLLSQVVPELKTYPDTWTINTGQVTDRFVDWFTVQFYDLLSWIKAVLFVNIFRPLEDLLLSLPWLAVCLTLGIFGFLTGGRIRGVSVFLLATFLAASGLWEKSMSTVYLCSLGVVSAIVVGMPLGVLSAKSRLVASVVMPVVNTLQTLPPFLYLVPAIMMFGTGDFSAFFAIFLFAVVPMVRYSEAGIRSVPEQLNEAGRQMGSTRFQLFWNVEFPVAVPMLLVGVNQTILLGLSMLVVTALIGTHDLGQEALYALQKSNPGRAIVAGLGIATIAIISDRLIGGLAEARSKAKRNLRQVREKTKTVDQGTISA